MRTGVEAVEKASRVDSLLGSYPRLSLAQKPTPLEPADRLSRALGGSRIWVKRDDSTGLAGGGNKARKLEFILAQAVAEGADILVTAGAVQSNHARQVAAAARRVGMDCLLVLTHSVNGQGEAYHTNGNVFLDRVLGAEMLMVPGSTESGPAMDDIAVNLKARGRHPFIIPVGGSNALGTLGYVAAFAELAVQFAEHKIVPTSIVLATGSGGTQAGLLIGASLSGWEGRVLGVSVGADEARQQKRVRDVMHVCADLLGIQEPDAGNVHVDARYIAGGYGLPDAATRDAVRLFARTEGLLVDPVYTGKAAAGLIQLVSEHALGDGEIVFLHTGGAPALAAYPDLFSDEGK